MSEQHNWRVYSVQLQELLDTTTPFIPFLGVLLTTTVQYHSRLEGRPRKVSGIEDYTLLEAITVRNRYTLRSVWVLVVAYTLLEAITVRNRYTL